MTSISWERISIIVIVVLLAACGGTPPTPTPQPEPTATITPEPSDTPVPTATDTPEPTNTPEPTATDTPEPTNTPEPKATRTPKPTVEVVSQLELGERELIPQGGFSFQPVFGYEWDVEDGQLFLSDEAGKLIISVVGMLANDDIESPDVLFDEFINIYAELGDGALEKTEAENIVVDNAKGTFVELTGEMFDSPVEGRSLFVQTPDNYWLFALGISNLYENEEQWRDEGQLVFTALIDSIVFEETAVTQAQPETEVPTSGSCTIAVDDTYGYTEDNPIRVGGDAWDGPPRERAFFDNLLGPNGETITYTRDGSFPYGDTILDAFSVTYPGIAETAVIYVDEYTYSAPMAPVGFTCIAEFPLSAP